MSYGITGKDIQVLAALRAAVGERNFARKLQCRCSDFVLQYEGECACERGKAIRAAEEKIEAALSNISPIEGVTMADATQPKVQIDLEKLMRETIGEQVIERLAMFTRALKFYADKEHMSGTEWEKWDSVTGEPPNWRCPPDDRPMMIEDGGIARSALRYPSPRIFILGREHEKKEVILPEESIPEGVMVQNQQSTEERGWLIENGKQGAELRYRSMEQGFSIWVADPNDALRFSRRIDAEMFSAEDEEAWRITEHTWHSI